MELIRIDLLHSWIITRWINSKIFDILHDIFNLSSLQVYNRYTIYIKYYWTKRKICKKIALQRSILQSLIFIPTTISHQPSEFASAFYKTLYPVTCLIQLYQFHQRHIEFIHRIHEDFVYLIDRLEQYFYYCIERSSNFVSLSRIHYVLSSAFNVN